MKNQTKVFSMRISPREHLMIVDIARRLGRSQSDTLRVIAREVWQAMKNEETKPNSPALEPVSI